MTQNPVDEHCMDCCCARAWKALGVTHYTGKSISEHIEELRTHPVNQQMLEALKEATKRSNYPWSDRGEYEPMDWKNEGAIELAQDLLDMITLDVLKNQQMLVGLENLKSAKDFVVKYGISGNLSDNIPAMQIAMVEMTIRDLINAAITAAEREQGRNEG